jgi:hypothetical protein
MKRLGVRQHILTMQVNIIVDSGLGRGSHQRLEREGCTWARHDGWVLGGDGIETSQTSGRKAKWWGHKRKYDNHRIR